MRRNALVLFALALSLTACGSKPNVPKIQAAHTYGLAGFQPSKPVAASLTNTSS